jgi:hypothetical protein
VSPQPFAVLVVTPLPESNNHRTKLSVLAQHRRTSIIDGNGKVIRREPREETLLEASLERREDGWLVQELKPVSAHASTP